MPSQLRFRLPSRAAAGVAVLVLALVATGLPDAHGQEAVAGTDAFVAGRHPDLAGRVIADRIVVRWSPQTSTGARTAARSIAGTKVVARLGDRDFQLLRLEPGRSMGTALRALRADPRVATAEPDRYLIEHGVPDDPDLPLQWAVRNTGISVHGTAAATSGSDIDVVPAWARSVGTPRTLVAVIDSGYDFLNADLGAVAWSNPGEIAGNGLDDDDNGKVDDVHGWDFVGADLDKPTEDNDPTDDDLNDGGHGLHVAGIIGARGDDSHGITGVAQDVRLMPLRVCTASATKYASACSLSAIVAAINYAGRMRARVANLSLGGPVYSQAMADALAANPRTLYVVSAGNNTSDNDVSPTYPCSYDPVADSKIGGRIDNVICVAASDQSDQRATFSNWGRTSVDLAAPGVNIWSLYRSATVWADDFERNDFASRWSSIGGFGRGQAGDGTLISRGLTDSPGTAPTQGLHQVTSMPSAVVSENVEACRVQGDRYARVSPASTFSYAIRVDGAVVPELAFAPAPSPSVRMQHFQTTPFDGALVAGKTVSLEISYDAGTDLDPSDGIWMDNLKVVCSRSYAKPALYEFLSGTSMSSPMVTGGAALLFSLKSGASVAQVRNALLGSVRKRAAWTGRTRTGGRLDVAAAMGRLVPPDTVFAAPPRVAGRTIRARFAQNSALPGIRFQCALDRAAFRRCSRETVVRGLRPGKHVLRARAIDPYGNPDRSPVAFTFWVSG